MILGFIGCKNDQPDLSWGKSAMIVTNQVFNNETRLILPDPWEVRFKSTSKGPEGSKRIYFKDELVLWYRTNIRTKVNNHELRTLNSDTIIKRVPIIIAHLTNDTTDFVNVYELQENQEYSDHYFLGYSNPGLKNVKLINRLYEYLLDDLSK